MYSDIDGSSPHTWGIHRIEPECQLQDRFIPTYVGHTKPAPPSSLPTAVHPHIRGAYWIHSFFVPPSVGSSPPTWGIRSVSARSSARSGSSPPTWGILSELGPEHWKIRFIPTYVGHTSEIRRTGLQEFGSSPPTWGIPSGWGCHSCGHPVHPHLRGAYSEIRRRYLQKLGSSPPTWGIP